MSQITHLKGVSRIDVDLELVYPSARLEPIADVTRNIGLGSVRSTAQVGLVFNSTYGTIPSSTLLYGLIDSDPSKKHAICRQVDQTLSTRWEIADAVRTDYKLLLGRPHEIVVRSMVGHVLSFDEDIAHVYLEDSSGFQGEGTCEINEIRGVGLNEGDRFIFSLVRGQEGLESRIKPLVHRPLTPAEEMDADVELEAILGPFSEEDGY